MKNLIVTLLSDQTIPNVQFIKEKQDEETNFLFVSSPKMEGKGVGKWIRKVCNIVEDRVITKIVDQFSPTDIENKLNELNYDNYEKMFINVTGGTKIMSHIVTEFFKEKPDTEIYYLTGSGSKYLQVFPKTRKPEQILSNQITLKEYIEAFGFEMREGSFSDIELAYTKQYLNHFLNFGEDEWQIFHQLRGKRGKTALIAEIQGLQSFLCKINFPLSDEKFLTVAKNEVKYLTGDWFEEFIYYRLKKELDIADENIKTGITLKKNNTVNEFDIVFFYNGTLYTIECKTSIVNKSKKGDEETETNILTETVYKATALQKNLGLYSNFSIFTLSSKESKEVKDNHLERGKLFNIDVFSREDIMASKTISELLKLSIC